jgi:hypothetical protein
VKGEVAATVGLDPERLDRIAVADAHARLAGVIAEKAVQRGLHSRGHPGDSLISAQQARPEHVDDP